MPDELITTQPEGPITSAPVVTGPEAQPGTVDQAPDPASLKAEIDRLEKVRKEAEEKTIYWRKQKAESRADFFKVQREPEPVKPAEPDLSVGPEPRKEDFDDYDKYNEAKIAFEIKRARTAWERDETVKSQDQTRQTKMFNLQKKIEQGYQKYPDFEEIALDRTVPITPLIAEILAESENSHDIAYYLGKNRAEAIAISHMTPIQAAKAIGRIETEIAKAGGITPSPPKITGAPAPINPLGSGNVVNKDPEKMTQREYEAWRKSQGARQF